METLARIMARVTPEEHRRMKAAAALAGQDLQDWAAAALRQRLAEDEAARQRPAEPQTEGGE